MLEAGVAGRFVELARQVASRHFSPVFIMEVLRELSELLEVPLACRMASRPKHESLARCVSCYRAWRPM
jgi:hypothetical protein